MRVRIYWTLVFLVALATASLPASASRAETLLTEEPAAAPAEAEAAPEKGPPLPFHTIEGVGGGAITPMAYLVNPAGDDIIFGKPSAALSYVNLGRKNLDAITVTENVGGRIELGYGADRLGLGTLPADIRTATVSGANPSGIDINHSDAWLHSFNIRALLVKEDDCLGGVALPAITAGIQIKYNDSIDDINNRLGGALTGIGYRRNHGEDFTLTATKTFKDVFGRPLIVTAGMRESESANLGFLGFGNTYRASFEGNVAYVLNDWLLVAYEFRQKKDPYTDGLASLIGEEDNWHAIDVGLILNKHTTLVAGFGEFGTLANSDANSAWWFQLKHEF
jgi:hypothetical protein